MENQISIYKDYAPTVLVDLNLIYDRPHPGLLPQEKEKRSPPN